MGVLRNPPDISKMGFLALLDLAIDRLGDAPPFLAGSIPCATHQTGDAPPRISPWPRLGVQLEGPQFYDVSVLGKRTRVSMSPMRGIYWATNSWSIDHFDTIGEALGLVLQPKYLRFIQVRVTGSPPPGATPWAYHTSAPLGGAGMMVARALDRLTDDPDGASVARDLFLVLLRLARQHLLDDDPEDQSHDRVQSSWRAVQTHIEENFSATTSRKSVADAMRLHPNYLSRLARRVTGQSFRQVLESIRMEYAKRLLRHTDQKLHGIAAACGYSDAPNFSRAFHRATGTTPGRFRKPTGNRGSAGDFD
jgi:AraC-like DNA-binding protein